MFKQLKGQIEGLTAQTEHIVRRLEKKADATQHCVADLSDRVANQENLAILSEDFNTFAGDVKENKDIFEGSLQRIQNDLDQTTDTLKLTHATVNEQTRRLDEHDAKLLDLQNSSFLGSKNSLEKLEDFKDKHDRLSSRVLQVEDWMRSQAPKNPTLDLTDTGGMEGTSKYIPPNERSRANPKVGM